MRIRIPVFGRTLGPVAALGLLALAPMAVAVPAAAQSADEAQMAEWSAEKQTAYEAWPKETKAYYWKLTPERQQLFWGLADTDKVTLSGMSEEDQEQAWARIESRGAEPSG